MPSHTPGWVGYVHTHTHTLPSGYTHTGYTQLHTHFTHILHTFGWDWVGPLVTTCRLYTLVGFAVVVPGLGLHTVPTPLVGLQFGWITLVWLHTGCHTHTGPVYHTHYTQFLDLPFTLGLPVVHTVAAVLGSTYGFLGSLHTVGTLVGYVHGLGWITHIRWVTFVFTLLGSHGLHTYSSWTRLVGYLHGYGYGCITFAAVHTHLAPHTYSLLPSHTQLVYTHGLYMVVQFTHTQPLQLVVGLFCLGYSCSLLVGWIVPICSWLQYFGLHTFWVTHITHTHTSRSWFVHFTYILHTHLCTHGSIYILHRLRLHAHTPPHIHLPVGWLRTHGYFTHHSHYTFVGLVGLYIRWIYVTLPVAPRFDWICYLRVAFGYIAFVDSGLRWLRCGFICLAVVLWFSHTHLPLVTYGYLG